MLIIERYSVSHFIIFAFLHLDELTAVSFIISIIYAAIKDFIIIEALFHFIFLIR